jgi:hypothetical protein
MGTVAAYPAVQGLRRRLFTKTAALIPFNERKASGEELEHFGAQLYPGSRQSRNLPPFLDDFARSGLPHSSAE